MNAKSTLIKIKLKVHARIVRLFRNTSLYYWIYPSFIHSKIHSNNYFANDQLFLTARPNPGAGIGHQIANWTAGFWFANKFNLKFAHTPFSTSVIPFSIGEWDRYLGFGIGETQVEDLVKNGYKQVRLPLFNEDDQTEVSKIEKIINSYAGRKVVFCCEQDQFYKAQYGVRKDMQDKFYNCPARAHDRLIYNSNNFNIAIHVRRGDIVQKTGENNPNLSLRWLDNEYFVNALKSTLTKIETNKPIHIYLFSQGSPEDYPEFVNIQNLHYCLDMPAKESFLHMSLADALITSKSSFSYKPALLNKGLKICPSLFWHEYPESSDWVLLNNSGDIMV